MVGNILGHVTEVVELVGVAILLIGFAESLLMLVKARFSRDAAGTFEGRMAKVRMRLGTYLMLGLEFMIAGDIIMTITRPTRDEMILVAMLVAIRSAIGYFLGKELHQVHEASATGASHASQP